ncbi:MAG: hypothetical protein ACRDKD_00560, partial [Solirubrobacteraceae bacterium]
MTSAARPAHLSSGVAKSQVQEITISTEAGFELKLGEKPVGPAGSEGIFVTEPFYAEFGGAFPQANAAGLQAALEEADGYGPGNVQVSEHAGEGTVSFVITTVGEDADRAVTRLRVEPLIGTAEAKVTAEG